MSSVSFLATRRVLDLVFPFFQCNDFTILSLNLCLVLVVGFEDLLKCFSNLSKKALTSSGSQFLLEAELFLENVEGLMRMGETLTEANKCGLYLDISLRISISRSWASSSKGARAPEERLRSSWSSPSTWGGYEKQAGGSPLALHMNQVVTRAGSQHTFLGGFIAEVFDTASPRRPWLMTAM